MYSRIDADVGQPAREPKRARAGVETRLRGSYAASREACHPRSGAVPAHRATGRYRAGNQTQVRATPFVGSLAGHPVALPLLGEALDLPFVHVGQPIQRGGWANPWVIGHAAVTDSLDVLAIQLDACMHLITDAN